jgi:hypothetical protein
VLDEVGDHHTVDAYSEFTPLANAMRVHVEGAEGERVASRTTGGIADGCHDKR